MATDETTNSASDNPAGDNPSDGSNWTEKQLPPVKPPTTGLLMQLFFVPMIIVSIIVGVWLMFGWLAQSGTNPEQLASNLRKLNKGSWQDAYGLSNMLRDPREEELRRNEKLASELSETLNVLLQDKQLERSPERIELAAWLCRALGLFEIDAGLDVLIQATKSNEFDIRREAVIGISTLAANVSDIQNRTDMVDVLSETAMERTESPESQEQIKFGEIRSSSAYALGVVGGEQAISTLALMLGDAYPEARYNAATGLARNGDVRAVPRLLEMLSLDNSEATLYEVESGSLRHWKRDLVIENGLNAVKALYSSTPNVPIDEKIVAAVNTLDDSNSLQGKAAKVLKEVSNLINKHAANP